MMSTGNWFARFAKVIARASGHASTFGAAVLIVAVWAVTGPFFHFSDTWQLVINTGTTIVTFLMVFLIQNTQNRDSVAMQVKLDELLRALKGAETAMADLEDLTEAELDAFKKHYASLAAAARNRMRHERRLPFVEPSEETEAKRHRKGHKARTD
jgi:low affinity Fe/Cu permease